MFYQKKRPKEIIVPVVTLLARGCPVSAIESAFGLKAEMVGAWAVEVGVHCEQVHRHLVLVACLLLRHV